MSYVPGLPEAEALLRQYNEDPFHIRHGRTVSGVMAYFAREFDPGREEFWAAVGMLHDLDFERWPEEHCQKEQQLMTEMGLDPELIRACVSHGWGISSEVKPGADDGKGAVRGGRADRADRSGGADAAVPERFGYGAQVPEEKIQNPRVCGGMLPGGHQPGAEMLGWELDDLLSRTLEAMKTLPPDLRDF